MIALRKQQCLDRIYIEIIEILLSKDIGIVADQRIAKGLSEPIRFTQFAIDHL